MVPYAAGHIVSRCVHNHITYFIYHISAQCPTQPESLTRLFALPWRPISKRCILNPCRFLALHSLLITFLLSKPHFRSLQVKSHFPSFRIRKDVKQTYRDFLFFEFRDFRPWCKSKFTRILRFWATPVLAGVFAETHIVGLGKSFLRCGRTGSIYFHLKHLNMSFSFLPVPERFSSQSNSQTSLRFLFQSDPGHLELKTATFC